MTNVHDNVIVSVSLAFSIRLHSCTVTISEAGPIGLQVVVLFENTLTQNDWNIMKY